MAQVVKTSVIITSNLNELRYLDHTVEIASFGGRTFLRHQNRNGDVGGFVENTAFAGPNTYVGQKAVVLDKAKVTDIGKVFGAATVSGNARVMDYVSVSGTNTILTENAVMSEHSRLYNDGSVVRGEVYISGNAAIAEHVVIEGRVNLKDNVHVYGTPGSPLYLGGEGTYGGDAWYYTVNGSKIRWVGNGEIIISGDHFRSNEDIDSYLKIQALGGAKRTFTV